MKKTEYEIAESKYRISNDYVHNEHAMKKSGIQHPYIDNILISAFASGYNAKEIKLPTPSDLEAMAMEKFPVKLIRHSGIHPDIDGNEENRAIFLSGLQAAVKMMGGQE